MSKVTDISTRRHVGKFLGFDLYEDSLMKPDEWKFEQKEHQHIAATVTPEDCFLISQPSHQVLLTREQAEFVLPHLQRWLGEK